MTSPPAARRLPRLAGAVLAPVVLAGLLTPLAFGGAAAAAPLPAPSVVGPQDATPVVKQVVLDWAPVAGARSYVVQVGTDEQWSHEPTLELTTVGTRLTLPVSLPHASYVWRVAAVGADGQGRWSSMGTFTRGWSAAPRPLSPVSEFVGPEAGVPTFRWTPVPTASEYQLQVSTSPTFDAPFRTQAGATTESCFTTRTSVTPFNGQVASKGDGPGECRFSLLNTGRLLHWRVRALDRIVGEAPEVDTTPVVDEGLTTRPPARAGELDTSTCPAEPDPLTTASPIGGSVPSPSASPSGSPDPSASASPVASPSASPSAGAERGSCEPAHTVEKGAWSAGASFSHLFGLSATAPFFGDLVTPERPMAAPVAPAGTCRGGTCRDFPTLTWPRVEGAQWYRVTVALDAAYTNIQSVVETPALTWTPTVAWRDSTAGRAYHVVVQPCTIAPTADGRTPGCDDPSAPLVFGKSSPRLAPVQPAPSAFVGGSDVVLAWEPFSATLAATTGAPATSEAYAYRVQVTRSSDPDFTKDAVVEDVVVDAAHHVSTKVRYPDGTYLWRAQAVDASGHGLPWSTPRAFTRDATAPTFAVVSASRLAPTGGVTVRFSEPVVGAQASTVTLSGTPAVLKVAADRRSATLQPRRPLLPGARHAVSVTAAVRDRAGNPVATRPVVVSVDPTVDDRSPVVALGGSWKRLAATDAVARTWSRSVPTAARPTTATVLVHGRGALVRGCVGPGNGVVEVYGDGARVARVDTYRSYSGCGVVLARADFKAAGVHRLQVRGTGAKSARSRGTAVGVDAVLVIR